MVVEVLAGTLEPSTHRAMVASTHRRDDAGGAQSHERDHQRHDPGPPRTADEGDDGQRKRRYGYGEGDKGAWHRLTLPKRETR